jgi:Uma2 family endonuclease
MSTTGSPTNPTAPPSPALPPPFDALAALPLVETDGVPLETPWHRTAINLLIEVILLLLRNRTDFYVGGNMFLYYSAQQVRNREFRGPDFFYVNGVDRNRPRQWWAVWEEGGRTPDVIIELLSPSTAEADRTTNRTLAERIFHTAEYFCYEPETNMLEGWRMGSRRRYRAIRPNEHGWLWSEELQLWLGAWTGTYQETTATWLRFYDREGRLVPTEQEAEKQQTEAALRQADAEKQRAEAEKQRAETEKQRADTAESELARLRARLAELEQQPPK